MSGRTLTREFKLAVVRHVSSDLKRPAQVCREHHLADSVLARWPAEYAECGEDALTPREVATSDILDQRIAELRRLWG
jgi:transposase